MIKIALSDIADLGSLQKDSTYLVKVLQYKSNSTLIKIQGHTVSVPFLLSKDKTYRALIKEGKLQLTARDIPQKTPPLLLSGAAKEEAARKIAGLLSSLLDGRDKGGLDPWLSAIPFFVVQNEQDIETRSKSFPFLFKKKDDDSYMLFFSLPVFDIPAKVACKISGDKRIFLNLLLSSVKESVCLEVKERLEKYLEQIRKKQKALIYINVTRDRGDFVDVLRQNTGLSGVDVVV